MDHQESTTVLDDGQQNGSLLNVEKQHAAATVIQSKVRQKQAEDFVFQLRSEKADQDVLSDEDTGLPAAEKIEDSQNPDASSFFEEDALASNEDQEIAATIIQSKVRQMQSTAHVERLRAANNAAAMVEENFSTDTQETTDDQDIAAIIIQSKVRQLQSTAHVKKLRMENNNVACMEKNNGTDTQRTNDDQDIAAIIIQSKVRQMQSTLHAERLRAAKINCTSVLEENNDADTQETADDQEVAAIIIQSKVRQMQSTARMERLRAEINNVPSMEENNGTDTQETTDDQDIAAIIIQSKVRQMQSTSRVERLRAAKTNDTSLLEENNITDTQETTEDQDIAAIIIQSKVRQMQSTSRVERLRAVKTSDTSLLEENNCTDTQGTTDEQDIAAVIIQSKVRQMQSTSRAERLRAENSNETSLSEENNGMDTQETTDDQDIAAIIIQAKVRQMQSTARVERLRAENNVATSLEENNVTDTQATTDDQYIAAIIIQSTARQPQATACVEQLHNEEVTNDTVEQPPQLNSSVPNVISRPSASPKKRQVHHPETSAGEAVDPSQKEESALMDEAVSAEGKDNQAKPKITRPTGIPKLQPLQPTRPRSRNPSVSDITLETEGGNPSETESGECGSGRKRLSLKTAQALDIQAAMLVGTTRDLRAALKQKAILGGPGFVSHLPPPRSLLSPKLRREAPSSHHEQLLSPLKLPNKMQLAPSLGMQSLSPMRRFSAKFPGSKMESMFSPAGFGEGFGVGAESTLAAKGLAPLKGLPVNRKPQYSSQSEIGTAPTGGGSLARLKDMTENERARELTHRLAADRRQREKRLKKKQEKELAAIRDQVEKDNELRLKKAEEEAKAQAEAKKKDLEERMEAITNRKKQREETFVKEKEEARKNHREKPLFKRMEEESKTKLKDGEEKKARKAMEERHKGYDLPLLSMHEGKDDINSPALVAEGSSPVKGAMIPKMKYRTVQRHNVIKEMEEEKKTELSKMKKKGR